jgi:DNA-directed RNA polymerase subunit RPC12/RpoP
MDLFGKIGSVTKSVVNKTSNRVTIARLNSKINGLKSGIGVQKQRIGDFYWLQHYNDESFNPTLSGEFKQIAEYMAQIEELEKEIQQILENEKFTEPENVQQTTSDSGINCPSCGASNIPDSKFCVTCGAAFIAQPETAICGNCGAVMSADAKFCALCGAKLENDGLEED